jgi:hypothetical protein
MQGEYNFLEVEKNTGLGAQTATPPAASKPAKKAKLAMFHFILPALV